MASIYRIIRKSAQNRKALRVLKRAYSGKLAKTKAGTYQAPEMYWLDSDGNYHHRSDLVEDVILLSRV